MREREREERDRLGRTPDYKLTLLSALCTHSLRLVGRYEMNLEQYETLVKMARAKKEEEKQKQEEEMEKEEGQ